MPLDPSIPTFAVAALAAVSAGALAHGLFHPRSSLFCPTIARLPAATGAVALTFDDGPWPGSTERILDCLADANVHANFFVIGRYAAAHPHLVRRMRAEGHLVGNHSYDHHRAGLFRGAGYWHRQISATDALISEILGEKPRFFRPPMGFKSPPLVRAVRRTPHRVVAWSRRACDGVTTTPQRIHRRLRSVEAGDIVLLHDGRDPASRREMDATAVALPGLLAQLARAGLTPRRLDHLL